MNSEEQIRKIMSDATEGILNVLRGDSVFISKISDNIDETVNKIMKDAFSAKTLLVDANNIDKNRYGYLEYMSNSDIEKIYDACKDWCETGVLSEDSEYKRFCLGMSGVTGKTLEDELQNNIDIVILKKKEKDGHRTRFIDGETTT
jgi:hypothetical protein